MMTILVFQATPCTLVWLGLLTFMLIVISMVLTFLFRDEISNALNSLKDRMRKIRIPVPKFNIPHFAPGLAVSSCILAVFIWFAVVSEKKPCSAKVPSVASIILHCGCK